MSWKRVWFALTLALTAMALIQGRWSEAVAWGCCAMAEWRLYNNHEGWE